jgi:hypothetical protein
VTSIADLPPRSRGLAGLRAVLLLAVLAAFGLQSPAPWGGLWLVIPAVVAVALLLSWRFGAWGLVVPSTLALGLFALGRTGAAWAWWIPTAALCGVWMGLREEGGEERSGDRAWCLLPVLLVAALLPRTPYYAGLLEHIEAQLQHMLQVGREIGYSADRLAELKKSLDDTATLRRDVMPNVLPTALFLWVAMLVYAGRSLSARIAGAMRWPVLTRGRLSDWRMPDGALWAFIAAVAMLLTPWPAWMAPGWTLLINTGIAFCVQGIAVVESWLLARGVPSSIIALTLLFVFVIALPVSILTSAAVGLGDAWLDFRHLEPGASHPGEENS